MEASQADLNCSFCGRASSAVRNLIAGRGVFICNDCVVACRAEVGPEPERPAPKAAGARMDTTLVDVPDSGPRCTMIGRALSSGPAPGAGPECMFCGRAKNQVRAIVERASVRICNECVGLCEHIIAAEASP